MFSRNSLFSFHENRLLHSCPEKILPCTKKKLLSVVIKVKTGQIYLYSRHCLTGFKLFLPFFASLSQSTVGPKVFGRCTTN